MSDPFLAEIRIFAGDFAPRNWATCDGQIMPISQNTALFSLIGTTYGGDGKSNMGLPDLQGRAPMHPGDGPGLTDRVLGEEVGEDTVTLIEAEIPVHSHALRATTTTAVAGGPDVMSALAKTSVRDKFYQSNTTTNLVALATPAVSNTGGGLPHANMQPYLAVTFIIALQGNFPQRP